MDTHELRVKALGLNAAAQASRERLRVQHAELERLRAEVASLRQLAAAPPRHGVTFVSKETASDSARVAAVSLRTVVKARPWRVAPYAALAAFAAVQRFELPARAVPAPAEPVPVAAAPAAPADEGASEALTLAHEWTLPGDQVPLAERLGPETGLPGTRPAWSAERTGERVYRVTFRADDAAPAYEFDVDLDARRVDPAPGTAELLTPRLTALR